MHYVCLSMLSGYMYLLFAPIQTLQLFTLAKVYNPPFRFFPPPPGRFCSLLPQSIPPVKRLSLSLLSLSLSSSSFLLSILLCVLPLHSLPLPPISSLVCCLLASIDRRCSFIVRCPTSGNLANVGPTQTNLLQTLYTISLATPEVSDPCTRLKEGGGVITAAVS